MHRLVLAATVCCAVGAHAETLRFHATLSPATEVPPVTGAGTGQAEATLDTISHKLTYHVVFSGFTSPVTMAHLHGPAAPGANAGVAVPLGTNPVSPIDGAVTLTAVQQAQLVGGLWYANLHTAAQPKGAARGQLSK